MNFEVGQTKTENLHNYLFVVTMCSAPLCAWRRLWASEPSCVSAQSLEVSVSGACGLVGTYGSFFFQNLYI